MKFWTRQTCMMFLLGMAVPLIFAVIVQNVWEDYYITFRASKNLAMGFGLVFTPGERVHSFTSPLGTLIPAAFSAIVGPNRDELVLWSFRIFSAACLGLTAVLISRVGELVGWQRSTGLLAGIALLGDAKSIAFSTNGMETALMLLAVMINVYAFVVVTSRRWIWLGSAWAGIQWVRPDGFIFAIAISLGMTLFVVVAQRKTSISQHAIDVMKGLALGTILYLPWFASAWIYYGSPIPNTILSKSGMNSFTLQDHWQQFVGSFTGDPVVNPFTPPYASFGPQDPSTLAIQTGWRGLGYLSGLIWVAAATWLVPLKSIGWPARAFSLAFLLVHGYVAGVISCPYPWYWPPVALLGVLSIAGLLDALIAHTPADSSSSGISSARVLYWLLAAGWITLHLVLLILVGTQLYFQSRVIEFEQRREIGLFLRSQARSTDETVFLECLGHIGYFSQLRPLDFPGLASPRVVEARRRLRSNEYIDLISYLKPDWIVLRPAEVVGIERKRPGYFDQHYELARMFDQTKRLDQLEQEIPIGLPGSGYLRFDQTFIVLRKKPGKP